MEHLDKQMQQWSTRLRDDLRIGPPESNQLATTITREAAALQDEAKERVREASQIPLKNRLEELVAFQGWMELVHATTEPHPVVVRAQVVYQNYICFVYLGESCFNVLKKELPSGSTAKKCCRFLTDNPVRAFRNAVAHANWRICPTWNIGLARELSQRNLWSGSRFRSKTCPSGKRWRAARHMPAF